MVVVEDIPFMHNAMGSRIREVGFRFRFFFCVSLPPFLLADIVRVEVQNRVKVHFIFRNAARHKVFSSICKSLTAAGTLYRYG